MEQAKRDSFARLCFSTFYSVVVCLLALLKGTASQRVFCFMFVAAQRVGRKC